MKKFSDKQINVFAVIIIAAALFSGGSTLLDLPGLYADAVNPDYSAAAFLHPSENDSVLFDSIGLPLLGNIYHGTPTMLIGLPFYALFGTNVFTLRILNACYGLAILVCAYFILKKLTKSSVIPLLTCIAAALSISLIASFRTQFYINLPGVVFTLVALLFLLSDMPTNKKMLLSGLFAGLAVYSYFFYMFFFAAFIFLICLSDTHQEISKIRRLFMWGFGAICGLIPYVVGYASFLLKYTNAFKYWNVPVFIIFAVVLCSFLGSIFYFMFISKKMAKPLIRIYCIVFFLCVAISIIVILMLRRNGIITAVWSEFARIFLKLNVTGTQASLFDRIRFLIFFTKSALNNSGNENLIFGMYTSIYADFVWNLFLVMTIISLCAAAIFRNRLKYEVKAWLVTLSFIFSFWITSIPLESRLGTHHYISLFIFIYMQLCMDMYLLSAVIRYNHVYKIIAPTVAALIFVAVITLNIYNQTRFFRELKISGGRNMFTEQINILAEHAKSDELYLFPEWGFKMGFAFLTGNMVSYLDKEENYKDYNFSETDKKIILTAWCSNENEEYYKSQLESFGFTVTNIKVWYTRDELPVFYTIETKYTS